MRLAVSAAAVIVRNFLRFCDPSVLVVSSVVLSSFVYLPSRVLPLDLTGCVDAVDELIGCYRLCSSVSLSVERSVVCRGYLFL